MAVLYVLAGLICLVLLLLFLPLGIRVWWEEKKKRVYFSALFLRIPLYPPKPSGQKKMPPAPTAEPEAEEPFSFRKLKDRLSEGTELARALAPHVRPFCQAIRVPEFSLRLDLHAEDPAVTALEYGGVSAAFGLLWNAVDSLFVIPSPQIAISADFEGEKTHLSFHCRLRSSLYLLLRVAVPALKILLPRIRKSHPAKKQGA